MAEIETAPANPGLSTAIAPKPALIHMRSGWKRPLTDAELRQRQEARKVTGLQGHSQRGNNYRARKVGHMLRRVVAFHVEKGRPLDVVEIPLARGYVEGILLAQDAYERMMADQKAGRELSTKDFEIW